LTGKIVEKKVMGKVITTMNVLKQKEEAELVYEYTNRACQFLLKLILDGKTFLVTDSGFTIDIIDVENKKIVNQIDDLAGNLIRCGIIIDKMIFLGIEAPAKEKNEGNILVYDSKTFQKIGSESTDEMVTPFCFKSIVSNANQFMCGMSNGCLQVFSINKNNANPVRGASKMIEAAPMHGEIYQIIETWDS